MVLALDSRDLERGQRLTMTLLAMVVLASAKLEDDDLLRAIVSDDLRFDFRACNVGSSHFGGLARRNEQDVVEGESVKGCGIEWGSRGRGPLAARSAIRAGAIWSRAWISLMMPRTSARCWWPISGGS